MGDIHTTALHGDDDVEDGSDVAPPIRVTTTYDRSGQSDLVYRRYDHVTTRRLEAVFGAMEGGMALAYSSGMAATSAALRSLAPARMSIPEDLYGGTRDLVRAAAARGEWQLVEPAELAGGDVWWVETPSNPRCWVTDIAATVSEANERGVIVVVDSTFATPVLQQPLTLGAHAVMHSTTKFVGGHSDAMGGVLVTANGSFAADLRERRDHEGAIPGSLDSWLTLRGIRTLPLRVERQSATAQSIAEFLSGKVATVWYPTLEGQPGHDAALRQMSAGGALLSIEMESAARAMAVRDRLRMFRNATSLGGVESVADYRKDHDPSAPEGLIRLSVGLEAPRDLIADLEQALY